MIVQPVVEPMEHYTALILSRLGLVACSTVLPHTRLKREVDILTEPLGVMERMNLLCLEKDMVAEAAQCPASTWHTTGP